MARQTLTALTSDQLALLPVIRDKWLALGLSTAPADRPAAEAAIRRAYRRAGLDEPALTIWLASPMAGAIGAALLKARGAQVRAQVRAQVGAQVWAQVWAQVGAQVRDQVGAAGYGQHDANWLAFYDYFRAVGLEKATASLDALTDYSAAAGWFWPFRGVVICTDRPEALRRDDQGRLHSPDSAALAYRDGWSIFAWHGVRVAESIILRPEEITVAQIRDEQNAEIRRVLLERYRFDRFVVDAGAAPVHADETGTLYRINLAGDEPLVVVSLMNSTPEAAHAEGLIQAPDGSWRKQYVIRVPPNMHTAREAVAWTFGLTTARYRPQVET